jgi:putative endonuclease
MAGRLSRPSTRRLRTARARYKNATCKVYILTNRPNGTLYIGVTSDLARRIWEHRTYAAHGFTRRYGLKRLVYVERHDDIRGAIQREKNIKHWPRAWKGRLILALPTQRGATFTTASSDAHGWPGQEPGHDGKTGRGQMSSATTLGRDWRARLAFSASPRRLFRLASLAQMLKLIVEISQKAG